MLLAPMPFIVKVITTRKPVNVIKELQKSTEDIITSNSADLDPPSEEESDDDEKSTSTTSVGDRNIAQMENLLKARRSLGSSIAEAKRGEGEEASTSSHKETPIGNQNADQEGGVDKPKSTSLYARLAKEVANIMVSDDFIQHIASEICAQFPEAERAHYLARVSVINALFESSKPNSGIDKDIVRQIKGRATHEVYSRWVKDANLAAIWQVLHKIMLLGGSQNIHPESLFSVMLTRFILSCQWDKSKMSLARFIERINTSSQVYDMQLEAAELHSSLPDQFLCSALINALSQDARLVNFYEPWLFKGERYPIGGYGELKQQLLRWLQSRNLETEYGFGKQAKDKKATNDLPAVTAVNSKAVTTGTPAAGKQRQSTNTRQSIAPNSKQSDWIEVCNYCGMQGHNVSVCKQHASRGKPEITQEQRLMAKTLVKKLLSERRSKKAANGKAAESTSQANVMNGDTASSQANLYFLKMSGQVNMLGVRAQPEVCNITVPKDVFDPDGNPCHFSDLIMFDNGANINIYLIGAALPLTNTVRLDPSKTVKAATANGATSYNFLSTCPLVDDFFVHSGQSTVQSCILSEGRCVDKRWRVEYQPTSIDHPVPQWVNVHINSRVVQFKRYSNNLLYIPISEFVDVLSADLPYQANVTTRRNTAAASPISQTGRVTRAAAGLKVGTSYAKPSRTVKSTKPLRIAKQPSTGNNIPTSDAQVKEVLDDMSTIPTMEASFDLDLEDDHGSPITRPVSSNTSATKATTVHTKPADVSVKPMTNSDGLVPDLLSDDSSSGSDSDDDLGEPISVTRHKSKVVAASPTDTPQDAEATPLAPATTTYTTRGTASGYARPTLDKHVDAVCKEVADLHRSLGCIPYDQLAEMAETGKLVGTKLTRKIILAAAAKLPPCDLCMQGKARNYAHRASTRDAAVPTVLDPDDGAQNLRIDIMFTRSRNMAKQPCLVVTDELSGHTNIIYLASRKTKDVEAGLDKAIMFLEKHGVKVGLIKSDREGAFVDLNSKKYRFQLTAGPGTHEPVSESIIKALKEIFVCKREGLSFKLPRSLYPRLMEHVCVIFNHRLKSGATVTPAEAITGQKISAEDLIQGAFGRIALFHIPDEEVKRRKLDDLDSRAEFGIVIGFEPSNPKNLKVYLPVSRQIVTRRGGQPVGDPTGVIDTMNRIAAEEEVAFAKSIGSKSKSAVGPINPITDGNDIDDPSPQVNPTDSQTTFDVYTVYGLYAKVEEPVVMPVLVSAKAPAAPKSVKSSAETRSIVLNPTDPKQYYVPVGAFERISLAKAKLCLPHDLVDAAVIQELVVNMQRYNVWDYCEPDTVRGKHILRSMLFLKIKTTPLGDFDKLKARLVPDGSMQTPSEYSRTSSPTVDFSSLCVAVSLLKLLRAKMATADVPAAYLNATLKESIFMSLDSNIADIVVQQDPSLIRFRRHDGSIVVRLKRCIYGLKQSGAEWHDVIVSFLKSLGYAQSMADRCVFHKSTDGMLDLVTIHVDDLLFIFTNSADFQRLKTLFVERFGEMDFIEGDTHSYLGMSLQVLPDNSVFVNQTGYARSLVASYVQWRQSLDTSYRVKAYKTPSTSSLMELKPTDQCDGALKERVIHHIYSLMYLAQHTRPDMLFPVNYLSTLARSPPTDVLVHLDRAFGYLHGTVTKGLLLGADSTGLTLIADAAYAIHADGKGHTGVVVQMGGSPVLVQSLKQKLVTLSSTEAELDALVSGLKRLQPIRRLLEEINLLSRDPTKVKQDNKSTITIATSGEGYSGKSKHMRVRYHAIAEQIANNEIKFEHCPTTKMISDMLSKPGGGSNFTELVDAVVSQLPDD